MGMHTYTYGQLLAEALRLIFQGSDRVISEKALDRYRGEASFNVYLSGMAGAFNRCMTDLEAKQVTPASSHALNIGDGEMSGGTVRFRMTDVIPEFAGMRDLVTEEGGYRLTEYREEGDVLVLPVSYFDEGTVRVLYTKQLPRVSTDTKDDFPITLPDAVGEWVPYFLSSEVYRSDEPGEAGELRNRYEAAMELLLLSSAPRGALGVNRLYDMTEV